MNPDVYSASMNIPKQFTNVLYSEVKKLWGLDFISKYLLLYLARSVSVYLTFIKSFNALN